MSETFTYLFNKSEENDWQWYDEEYRKVIRSFINTLQWRPEKVAA